VDDAHKSKEQLIAELRELRGRSRDTGAAAGPAGAVEPWSLLEGLTSPLFIKDAEHRWVYMNKAAAKALGRPREEMLGRTDSAVYSPEYVDFLWNKDEYVLGTGKTISYEVRPPWRGGQHCLALKSRHVAGDGERYLVEILQDVTEIKEIQQALRESEGRLRSILNQSHVGVVVARRDGIVYTNPVMLARGGYTSEEVIGRPILDFVHPEDRAMVAERSMRRYSGRSDDAYYCYRLLRKDGSFDWIGVYSSTVDWGGEDAGLAFIVDLSEQKQAEAALTRSETRLRRVVDLVPHAIYARHADGRFLLANKAASDLCGCPVADLTGDAQLSPGTLRVFDSLAELEEPVLSGAKPFQVAEVRLADAAGRTRHLEYSAVSFPLDQPGRAVLGVCTDVTSREAMRQRLERFNDCLLHFGSEPEANINSLVALCGEVLGGACALYSRREGGDLLVAGRWNTPPALPGRDRGEGHLCMDVILSNREHVQLVRNLAQTPYAQSDPNVAAYGLKTYVGIPVRAEDRALGSLCVVWTEDRLLSQEDEWLLSVAASAIAVEERRQSAQQSLRQNEQTLRALADATSDMMILLDLDGRVLAANAKAAAAFGTTPAEMVGRDIEHLHGGGWQHARWQALRSAERMNEPEQFTEERDGRSLEHRVYPVTGEQGGVIRFALFSRDVTEAREAELRLAESEERFRTAFEQAAVGMAHLSSDGAWLRVNAKLCDITGYPRRELLGHAFSTIVEPGDRGPVMQALGQLLAGERTAFSREVRCLAKSGDLLWVHLTMALIRDEGGGPKYLSCVVEDISLRKQFQAGLLRRDAVLEAVGLAAEKFLLTSEWDQCIQEVLAGLGRAASACRAYVFENMQDETGRLCMVQRFEWCEAGVSEQLANPVLQLLPYSDCGLDNLHERLSSGRPMHGLVRDMDPGGRAILEAQGIQSLAMVPVFAGSDWWGFIGFDDCKGPRQWLDAEIEALMAAANIVGSAIARRRIEAALRESERKFRIIADAVQDVFWISTPDRRRIIYLSPAFERRIGPREELFGNPQAFAEAIHPEDRERVLRAYARRGPWARELEYRVRRRTGDWLWVRERAFPVMGDDGEMEWLAGITIDITDSRQAEEEIRRSLKEKELLLQEVHHRVKNNLQIITGLLDMAGRRIQDERAREIMRDTQSKIQGMAMIHLQLYGFERFDSIDMATYARQLTSQLAQMYGASSILPAFDLDEIHLPLSQAIPCGLVLSEMLSNVFKHAYPDGAGVLELAVKRAGGRICLRVSDQGKGLPPDILEQKLDSVGLKLLKNIVKFQLGGELHISSEHGTTVTISFQDEEKGEPSA